MSSSKYPRTYSRSDLETFGSFGRLDVKMGDLFFHVTLQVWYAIHVQFTVAKACVALGGLQCDLFHAQFSEPCADYAILCKHRMTHSFQHCQLWRPSSCMLACGCQGTWEKREEMSSSEIWFEIWAWIKFNTARCFPVSPIPEPYEF